MTAHEFVHLRTHSEYSMVDGLAKVADLAQAAAQLDMDALGLTDRGNLFGLIKFYRACLAAGVKPILGADLRHQTDAMEDDLRLTVLACSAIGHGNLLRLVSRAYTSPDHHGCVTTQQVVDHSEGLILLSGPRDTEIGQALLRDDQDGAAKLAKHLAQHFPERFYLEVQRTGRQDEDVCLRGCVAMAESLDLPVVATNEVCFLQAEDHEAHETRVCINESRTVNDPRRRRRHCAEQYLKPAKAMTELFADLPEAVRNSLEIARRCTVQLSLGDARLPDYPTPQGETLEGYLERMAQEGLDRRIEELRALGAYPLDEPTYRQRLADEVKVINETGFPGYFLIVMEFIAWAKAHNIPVGPGRGSGAGSLVAYALGITNLDPVHYDLLFERFLNPERVSMPDFDVDFCVEGRDQVITHVCERYGAEAVGQIATFGSMAAKAVVRDVARAQGKPFALGDKLSKLIPNRLGTTLASALAEVPELNTFLDEDEEAAEIMEMAHKLEGVVRNVGRHAGGVVIAPSRLTDFVPLYVDDRSGGLISQYDKDDVERAGLVKFDFLGLTTLTIINWAVQAANESISSQGSGELIDANRLPLDDQATFELLKRTETTGVFQLESRGMRELIRGLQPDNINDIIALVALYRPGPMENNAHQEYVERKHGRRKVNYPHPALQPVLQSTFGVVIYQEQVMETARVLAGFSLGQADILRKAMGKKDAEEMDRVRGRFLQGAKDSGVPEKLASHIFDQMATFAGYAFNKSHSATYALVAYQTAWLKAHYPAEFMAATLSADMVNTDKVVSLIAEVRRMKLTLAPPNVNSSEYRFSGRGRQIVYGLGAVRGLGRGPVQSISEARRAGPFKNLAEFCRRVDVKRVNKRVLEALIHAGAMDEFSAQGEKTDYLRARLLGEIDQALLAAQQASRDAELGMESLFGDAHEQVAPAAKVRPLAQTQRLELEKQALGLYLTGHPMQPYLPEFRGRCSRLADLQPGNGVQHAAGLVVDCRTLRRGRGRDMEILVLDDSSARMEAVLYPEVGEREKHKLKKGDILVLEGKVEADDYSGGRRMRVERALSIEEWRQRARARLHIDLTCGQIPADLAKRLTAALASHRVQEGGCRVTIGCHTASVAGVIALSWRVRASNDLMAQLRAEFGDDRVAVDFEDAA